VIGAGALLFPWKLIEVALGKILVPTSPLALAHDSKIMLGVLVVVLCFDRVAGSRRIAREH
jgi:hypothetical protein